MTSTVKLYANSKISPRKNFIIDNIADYLATLSTITTINDFQYIKHALSLEIKVDLSQAYLGYDYTDNYDYLSIKNSDQTVTVYYFIINKKWRGESTLVLTLSMDTVNTLKYGTDYTLDDKTKINRQHKDRYSRIDGYLVSGGTHPAFEDGDLYNLITNDSRVICFAPLEQESPFGFRNQDDTNNTMRARILQLSTMRIVGEAIEFCYISYGNGDWEFDDYNDDVLKILVNDTLYNTYGDYYILVDCISTETHSDLIVTNEMYLNYVATFVDDVQYAKLIDLTSEGVTPILYGKTVNVVNDDGQDWYLIYMGNNPVRSYICARDNFNVDLYSDAEVQATDLTTGRYYYIIDTAAGIKIADAYLYSYYQDNTPFSTLLRVVEYWRDGSDIKARFLYYVSVFGGAYVYNGHSDEYHATSMKVLADFSPVKFKSLGAESTSLAAIRAGTDVSYTLTNTTSTVYGFNNFSRTEGTIIKIIKLPYRPYQDLSSLKYDSGKHMLYLEDLMTPFRYEFTPDYNPLSAVSPVLSLPTTNLTLLRNKQYETKLLHSDYYQPKFVYDSATFVFALEKLNLDKYNPSVNFTIEFNVTNTINSKMLFTFPKYITDGKSTEDYDNILYVARNNEITALNSDYINYLRSGYNYDVKNKERQEAANWIGFGISTVGAIASFAASGATGGVSAAAGIALATSAMAQLVSAVNTTAQAEAAQAQKLTQLRNQRAAVFGADDVDLMSVYTGNKAKFMEYKCSEKMESILFDLFFYTGYVDGRLAIPNTTSRTRFNFVSCEPVFNVHKNIPEDILTDIELKFNSGITFIHKYNNTWDLDQKYENWETSIL